MPRQNGKIETATIIQRKLDEALVQGMTTGWMELNSNQVVYNGGAEVKVPTLLVDGLGNYDKNKGYKRGNVNFTYKTMTMTQDRGTQFQLDARDVDETNGSLTIASIMNEFQRTHVVAELDAYRISKLATTALENDGFHGDNETITKGNVIDKIKDGIRKLRDENFNGEIIIHATYEVITELEKAKALVANTTTFNIGGIETRVNQIDGCPIVPTSRNRMVTAIEVKNGDSEFGFEKGATAKDINFLIVAREVPIAITKIDTIRIFDPMTNQDANAWKADYRRFHDLWILDSKKKGIYVSCKAS